MAACVPLKFLVGGVPPKIPRKKKSWRKIQKRKEIKRKVAKFYIDSIIGQNR